MDAAHAVDIASLARQLKEELATADAAAARSAIGCPIVVAEVSKLTRYVNPEAYNPHHVSIGPYHCINPELARDEDKIRSLGTVLSAASAGVTLEAYLDVVARMEAQARSCYAHTFNLESNAFVRMLLLDACYVLVHFGGVDAGGRSGNGGDMMEAVGVVRDVIYLAENQIPFFVVDEIHKLTTPDGGGVSAADAIAGYVRELLRGQQYSVATPAVAGPPGPGNLLHLLHMHLTPTAALSSSRTTGDRVIGKQRRFGRWRSATEYYCAGVGFRSRPLVGKGARSILDVKLDGRGGTLEIPRLKIDAETSRLLRNLMALEQSNPAEAGSHVTAYCVFLSQLAGTVRDVELLSRRGIIAHGLGSHDEVAACLADLCKGVAFGGDDPGGNYLRATWQGLEESFRSRPRRWAAWLMLRYFRNPWLAVGLAAAAVGLVCTVVQAVYAVLSYTPNA
ncbi:unnamed protein product [Miscanthus lutarioriparius]|uniref:Uncharacterized protein n=1 Tax=Miscanthus lutarioriparius TaxID=422564 RepID=A0A811R6D1_9POAL|nr:unnamed protein product [Miscanthus lutarioriparius]